MHWDELTYGYLTPSTGFTVECWFSRTAIPNGVYEALWSQYTQANPSWSTNPNTNGRHVWFGMNTTGAFHLNAYKEDGTSVVSWVDPNYTDYASDGEWHHVAVRLASNKTTWTVIFDGEVKATITGSAAVDWKPGCMTVGGTYAPHLGNFGQFYLWSGAMALFAAVNKPLTDNRIIEHYTAAKGGTVYYGDNEVQRMTRILDWTDTPIPCRDLDAPMATLQGIEVAGTNALDALLSTAAAANGYVFADGQSWIQYHNKRHRYNRHDLYTFAESTGSAIEAGVDFITDDEKIYNDIRGKRPYGGSYRMIDNESVDQYGRRTYEFELPITSAEELRNSVGWLLSRYGSEHIRVSGIRLRAESSTLIEEAATGGIDIGDHFVIDDLPEWAPVQTMELTVEGLNLEADFVAGTWVLSVNCTPAEFDNVFQIGVSTIGGTDKVAL